MGTEPVVEGYPMTIDFSSDQTERLAEQAKLAGYGNVEEFAVAYLGALIQEPSKQDLPPLTDEQLRECAAACDRGMADVLAGRTLPLEEARQRSLNRLENRSR